MNPKVKARLGRGLSSLISVSEIPVERELPHPTSQADSLEPRPEAATQVPAGERLHAIPLDQVRPNPHQPRRTFDPLALNELAASLKSTGLIQPIVVRQRADGYELIAGERRWRAARQAGFDKITAIIRDVDSLTQAQMALIENIHRQDLNPIERAEAYHLLVTQLGLSHAELATRLGEERTTVVNHVRLLDLAEPVRERVRAGHLSLGHGKLLASVADHVEQGRLADLVVQQDLSVRNLERLVQGAPPVAPKPRSVPTAHVKDVERTLAGQLGMRVQLKSGRGGKGRVVIHYGSLDQFDALLERLGVKVEP